MWGHRATCEPERGGVPRKIASVVEEANGNLSNQAPRSHTEPTKGTTMTRVQTVIATTQRELDDALEVRDLVFRQEMNLIRGEPFQIARELNCFDTLDTTIHVVAYAGRVPVATVRMLLPNLEVARDNGTALGVDLEQKLDLSPLAGPRMLVAEVTRLCVRREWRRSEAVLKMAQALYR